NLSKPERLINIGAEGRKAHPIGIRASLSHQVDAQSMVGRPETGDSDCTVFEILQATNLLRRFWRRCEGKERQSPGRSKANNLGATGIGLKCHVESGAGVVHRVAN